MRRIAIIASLGLLVALVGAIGNQHERGAEAVPARIVVIPTNVCAPLRALAANGSDAPDYVVACINPRAVGGLPMPIHHYAGFPTPNHLIIAAPVMRDGRDDIFDAPDGSYKCENQGDTGAGIVGDDDDDDGVISDEEKAAAEVDDIHELICALDERDGEIDNQFELTAADYFGGLNGTQMHDSDDLVLFVEVDDDAPVTLETTEAQFATGGDDWVCDTEVEDEDCDGDGDPGDGIIVQSVTSLFGTPERGPAEIRATQEGVRLSQAFTIVGDGEDVSFFTLETSFGLGLTADDCPLATSVAGFTAALGHPQKSIVIARAADTDNVDVTGVFMGWETDDEDRAIMATGLTPTLDLGGFGKGAPNVICGTKEPGEVTVTATVLGEDEQIDAVSVAFDKTIFAGQDGEVTFNVLGEPADMTLAVAPASIACNGVNTAEVSATITDSAGNPVASNSEVSFNVKVLGTSNPINAKTDAMGVAKSTITPLAGQTAGVPVVVTIGDIQRSILVNCTPGGAAPVPGAPGTGAGAPTGTITGPDTGSGGQFAGPERLAVWPAVALFVGALGLIGVRFGLSRSRG